MEGKPVKTALFGAIAAALIGAIATIIGALIQQSGGFPGIPVKDKIIETVVVTRIVEVVKKETVTVSMTPLPPVIHTVIVKETTNPLIQVTPYPTYTPQTNNPTKQTEEPNPQSYTTNEFEIKFQKIYYKEGNSDLDIVYSITNLTDKEQIISVCPCKIITSAGNIRESYMVYVGGKDSAKEAKSRSIPPHITLEIVITVV